MPQFQGSQKNQSCQGSTFESNSQNFVNLKNSCAVRLDRLNLTHSPLNHIYQQIESNARSYCRSWPVSFHQARGHQVFDETGRGYIDFFAGAGALNYGHNNPVLKQAVISYLQEDGIVHSLDMHTRAKREFLETFQSLALSRLKDTYKIMFTGPTGTDAVEAALRLARKVTRRLKIAACSGGYHGMTAGALALSSGPRFERDTFPTFAQNSIFLPFDSGAEASASYADEVTAILDGAAEPPAALIYETIQGEGGVNVAPGESLRTLEAICRERGILTIQDDIQMGCGRTGPFFSSELHALSPDIIVLSKSIGAFGVPLSLVLIKSEFDLFWNPGEHVGTFRGQDLAFVAGKTALQHYWLTSTLENDTQVKGALVSEALSALQHDWPDQVLDIRGTGLMHGLEMATPELAAATMKAAFARGLLVERSGREKKIIKISPPLTIDSEGLTEGLSLLKEALGATLTAAG